MEFIHRRSMSPEDQNFKRRMKTPVQREALERVYAGFYAKICPDTGCIPVCSKAVYLETVVSIRFLCVTFHIFVSSYIFPDLLVLGAHV